MEQEFRHIGAFADCAPEFTEVLEQMGALSNHTFETSQPTLAFSIVADENKIRSFPAHDQCANQHVHFVRHFHQAASSVFGLLSFQANRARHKITLMDAQVEQFASTPAEIVRNGQHCT
jgi:hypothetical protein